MTTDPVGTFADALRDHDASLTRTDPGGFADALADLVEPPAVGAPLPFDDVSLDDVSLGDASIEEVSPDRAPPGDASLDETSPGGAGVETELTTAAVRDAATGVCAAGFAVAETGSVVLQPTARGEEPVSLFPGRHVVVVREADLVPDVATAFDRLAGEFAAGRDDAVLATGPSATADMGELVQGVHGPTEVHVLLVAGGTAAGDGRTAGATGEST